MKITLPTTCKTRAGLTAINLRLVPRNSIGVLVTFPIKGTIVEKGRRNRYQIWSIDGRNAVLGEHPDDLMGESS